MNLSKVKKWVIIILAILNATLLVLIKQKDKQYQINDKQVNSVISLLKKNNIDIEAEIPKSFKPLKQARLRPYMKDQFEMCDLFFNELLMPMSSPGEDSEVTTFEKDNKQLIIEKGIFTFVNPLGNGKIDLNIDEAKRICDETLEKLYGDDLNLQLDHFFIKEGTDGAGDTYSLEYRAVFEKEIIYSSYAKFTVSEKGIIRLKASLYEPETFESSAKNIHSPDEALIAFMHEWKNVYDTPTVITEIDMVYKTEEKSSDSSVTIKASPYYRIYVQDRTTPFLVNAYLNNVTNG